MTNLKALMERREELRQNMETLVSTADTECRAMTEEEAAQFDTAENELRAIDATIEREERTRGVSNLPAPTDAEERAAAEESAFVDYVLGRASELRAGEQNLTMANNGAIIPTSIADRIVTAVRDRCPILSGATIYRVNGTLKVPVWGKANTTHDIAVGYQTEFTELTADSGKFTSVDLSGYLAGALTLIGNSVENNSVFNVTDFIINQMAEEIALFLEKELLNGTSGKATGALSTPTAVTAASATAITADELIELQAQVKQVYQANACWTMAPETFTSLKKLKDSNGWRLGYIIAPPEIIDRAKKVHDFLTVGAAAPLQEAVVTGLKMGQDYYDDLQAKYTHKKDLFLKGLDDLKIAHTDPQGAYYVLLDIAEFGYESDLAFCEDLAHYVGVGAVPGSSFFREPVNNLIRLHFAKKDETLLDALNRLEGLRDKIKPKHR